MRKIFLMWILMVGLYSGQASAQDLKLRDVFKQMPDSLMPYLSQNNRLDFIDFLDSNMKAEVKNQLGGSSVMTSLSDDSLVIQMNKSLRTDLFLMKLAEPVDSIHSVIVMVETFLVDSIYGESTIKYYTPSWRLLSDIPPLTDAQKKRIETRKMQNMLKKDDDIVTES